MEILTMNEYHLKEVCNIRNYYIKNSTANLTLEESSYDEFYDMFKERLDNNYPKIVAVYNDRVIGYALLSPYRNTGYNRTGEISIYIDKDHYGMGVGNALFYELEKRGGDNGFHVLTSYITSENIKSINFHIRHGFKKIGELKEVGFKNNTYFDVSLYSKTL